MRRRKPPERFPDDLDDAPTWIVAIVGEIDYHRVLGGLDIESRIRLVLRAYAPEVRAWIG